MQMRFDMSDGFENKTGFVISHNTGLNSEYVQWVQEIKERFRNIQIADVFHHTGNAVTNFDQILPETQSKLAQEITKHSCCRYC